MILLFLNRLFNNFNKNWKSSSKYNINHLEINQEEDWINLPIIIFHVRYLIWIFEHTSKFEFKSNGLCKVLLWTVWVCHMFYLFSFPFFHLGPFWCFIRWGRNTKPCCRIHFELLWYTVVIFTFFFFFYLYQRQTGTLNLNIFKTNPKKY